MKIGTGQSIEIFQANKPRGPRIVHKHIDPPPARFHLSRQTAAIIVVGYVALDHQDFTTLLPTLFRNDFGRFCRTRIIDNNVPTSAGEKQCCGCTDTRG
jgi:hypothetical protein